jgi:hypothetical protein
MIGGVYHRRAYSNEIAEYHKLLNRLIMKKFPASFNQSKQALDWHSKVEKEYRNQIYWKEFQIQH